MSKTQIIILWGLAGVVVVVFVVLSQLISRAPAQSVALTAPPVREHHLPAVPHSAKSYYPRADQSARSWQGDAQLVSATSSWSFAQVDDFSEPVDWTYQFYSPGTQQLYVVSVGETEATTIVSSLSPYELPTVSIDRWSVDSNQALGTWLDYGGAQFLGKHSIVNVSARLRHNAQGGLEWSVAGLDADNEAVHMVRVDAASGQVIR